MRFTTSTLSPWLSHSLLTSLALLTLSGSAAAAKQTLLKGGDIISFDTASNSLKVIRNGCLLISGAQITQISASNSCINVTRETEVVDTRGKIISPGFIDTHRHGWQTSLRAIGSNTTIAEYFQRYGEFGLSSTAFSADDIYISQLTGLYEAINAGVTTTLDHAHHTWSPEQSEAGLVASVASGGRVVWCYALHELGTTFTVEKQMEDLERLVSEGKWKTNGGTVSMGLAYDMVATAPEAAVRAAWALASRLDLSAITIHFLGGPWGQFTTNDPTTLNRYTLLNTSIPIVFSHATHATPSDAQLLRDTNQYISITPESESHFGHDHHLIQDQAALGVDTHFTFSSDIITQARFWLQSTRRRLFSHALQQWKVPTNNPMSVNQAFLLATRNGGLALRRPDLGIIAVGAKADIVVIDGESPGMVGYADPIAAVILHAHVGDIEGVMINGEWKKVKGKLVGVDWKETKGRFLESAKRIQKGFEETEWPEIEGVFAPGIPYTKVDRVDVVRGDGNGY